MVNIIIVSTVTILFIARAMCRTIAAVATIIILLGLAVFAILWARSGAIPASGEMSIPVAALFGSVFLDSILGRFITALRSGCSSSSVSQRHHQSHNLGITMRPRDEWPNL